MSSKDQRKLKKLIKQSGIPRDMHGEIWRIMNEGGLDAASALIREIEQDSGMELLRDEPVPYRVWGEEYIDEGSFKQMDSALRLPVSVAGALMPDAHLGYGLPIGGVLATDNVVIPYAVGVDIACRMRMTVFPVSSIVLGQQKDRFEKALLEQTKFGAGMEWSRHDRMEHAVMDDPTWDEIAFVGSLKSKGYAQLGTSGSGNHFVEWGTLTLEKDDDQLDLKRGDYLALLSHSGSRGVGFQIANYYSKIASQMHPALDSSVKQLAWLPMDKEIGQEYWAAMQLAGRFAAANHEIIHRRVARAAGLKPVAVIENHHNFAWKEQIPVVPGSDEMREVIVHRKGATPAGVDVPGIIPGSMGDPGYVVRGLGKIESINSASHGAGRVMSRRQAKRSITRTQRDRYLKQRGVKLFGGGLDESPQVYKPIDDVIAAQGDLIDVIAKFTPRVVRMDDK